MKRREAAADPDHVLMAWMTDDRLGYAAQSDESGGVSLADPGPLMHLPRVSRKMMVERVDQLFLVLGVVAQNGKVLQIDRDEHGRRGELIRLFFEELLQ